MTDARVVVVTGASSGIGAALAMRLGARGDRIVLAARRERELEDIARKSGSGALAVSADVTRRPDVEQVRDRAIEAFGHIDVWVNNAGRGIGRRVLDLTGDEFDQVMAVNVKSALYGMQAAVPHFMERGRGHVINVSSFLSRVPRATILSAYSAAKAALNSLTANLRMDLAATHPGIHVTLVMPGLVSTEFHEHAIGGTVPLPPAPVQGTAAGQFPAAQTVEDVVTAIVGVIDRPVAEIYTNPAHQDLVLRYFEDVSAFERAQRGG